MPQDADSGTRGPTRRDVLRAATAGAGLALGAGMLSRAPASAASLPVAGTYDVVVVGAGAAGMTAALTAVKRGLSVLVVEKAAYFGGSLARSGAGVWIPNNEVILAAGVPDTPALATEYLAAVVGSTVPADRQAAFLANGPAMLSFVMANSPLKFQWMQGYSDYYPYLPGGMPNGRSVEPSMIDGHILGAELANLNPPYMAVPTGLVVFSADYKWLQIAAVNAKGVAVAAECLARGTEAALLGQAPLTMGQAAAAGLRAGLLEAGVPVWLNTPLVSLNMTGSAVTGVVISRGGSQSLVNATKGVIVAAGGFEHNAAMRAQYQQQPIGTSWTVGTASNTGDGILAGIQAGAALALMDDAWWGPVIPLPGEPYFCLAERTEPGGLLVNAAGKRFTNEAAPYSDVVHTMYRLNPTAPDIPAWLIVDQNYRDRYLFQEVAPLLPLPQSWYDAGAVFQSPTIAGLAAAIGVPRPAWRPPSPGSMASRRAGRTPTSSAASASTTTTTPTRPSRPTPAWRPCGCRPTTRSRSSRAISAPRADCSPMPAPGYSTPTARSSVASTPRVTRAPRSWGTATRERVPRSGRP